ncbi:glycoside hydrolase family 30 beta sandwich domain-containing protein [uncultured Lactobacillus sp.]|uniref:glycoside hydrolase family 30 protein n=1 Tax=uncultured Lactobacillus sp. TaxID=153152 RepID=UPI0026172F71|nr:glycoside hydrolase family 30 beta sandwich domain-containing protein [uncultured Lactobacillus sp.]
MAYQYEFWTETAGDLSEKRSHIDTPTKHDQAGAGYKIIIDPSIKKQNWIGAGAALTDAAASLIWKQTPSQRHALLTELFEPDQGDFSLIRLPMGSCDFGSGEVSKTKYYSYDDAPYDKPDLELKNFSIGEGEVGSPSASKDLKYIVPVLQEILKINPAVKILATPWSAPAWMKDTKEMTNGGHFRDDIARHDLLKCYAQYFIKFIEAYQKLGIPIHNLAIQNEPNCPTPWPAMIWTMRQLTEFGYKYLRPALDVSFPSVGIYLWDGSLDQVTQQNLSENIDSVAKNAFSGFAFHTYVGPYQNAVQAKRFNPNWEVSMTERRCMMKETVADASHIMMGMIGSDLVRQGISSIYLWNLALDERGLPNIAGSTGRRGVITINHKTGQVMRNLEYYMLRNFTQDVENGSTVIESSSYMKCDYANILGTKYYGGLSSVAFLGPDDEISAQIYNPTDQELKATVRINQFGAKWQDVTVPAYGTVTLHKANKPINESKPGKDETFKLNPMKANLA